MEVQKYRSGERRKRSRRGSRVEGEVEQVEGRREEDGQSLETSALTCDGGERAQGSLGIPELMGEGMISNV